MQRKKRQRVKGARPGARSTKGVQGAEQIFREGLAYGRAGNHRNALECFDQLVRLAPDHFGAQFNRGVSSTLLGAHERAAAAFAQAARIRPGDLASVAGRGGALLGLGQYRQALACFEEVLASDPGHFDALFGRGCASLSTGEFEAALESFDRVLEQQAGLREAALNRAAALVGLGRHAEAVACLDRLLSRNPDDAQALAGRAAALGEARQPSVAAGERETTAGSLAPQRPELPASGTAAELTARGTAAAVVGDFDTALTCFSAITRRDPQDSLALHNQGRVLASLKRLEEAADYFRRALAVRPDWPEARFNLGVTLNQLGRHQEVLAAFGAGAPLSPDHHDLHFNRGVALLNLDRFDEALESFTHALLCRPDDFGALLNRGTALVGLDREDEALECFERAQTACPGNPAGLVNMGVALHALDRPHASIDCLQRALSADSANADAWHNLGCALGALDRRQEARAACDTALRIDPDHASALYLRSLADLADGRLLEGFKAFENRWKVLPGRTLKLNTSAQLWLGDAPLAGRTLLLHAEQGLGDTLQFVRYVPMLAAMQSEAHVILRAPQVLLPLLQTLPGAVELVAQDQPLPAHDFHCPLLSLPLAFGTTLETIPAQIPYLRADPTRAADWARRLGPRKERPRVGVVWRGGWVFKRKALRDMSLESLRPLLELDAELISLQQVVSAEDCALLATLPIIRHGETLRDFADTAALVENLDLVITVDTAVAHLAGALGKPVWIMSRLAGCWRWLRDREDSPWYPTARLFRQKEFKNWEPVVLDVVRAGREFVHQWRRVGAAPVRQDGAPLPAPHSEDAAAAAADQAVALGASLGASGNDQEALLCFERALLLVPAHVRALYNRATALAHLGLHAQALAGFEQTLAIEPDHAAAMLGRGIALANLERFEEAVPCFEWMTARHPEHPEALCGLGFSLGKLGRCQEGLRFVDRALALRPDHADAHYRRGYLLCWLDRLTEALESFDRVLAAIANHADARCDRSLVLLARGQLAEGFRQYEHRWQTRGAGRRPATDAPLWLGEGSLAGKTLLVFAEQGLGDTLQFARYAALLAPRAAAVILRVPAPLVQLMRSLSAAVRVISEAEPLPAHDLQCPLLSLPLACATRMETIPAQVPYLHSDRHAAAQWDARLGAKRRPRIGVAWAGRQVPPLTRVRDVALEALLPLFELDAEFISLQQTVPERDLALLERLPLARHGEQLRDFADSAALIANLDLVISVDTAVVHLAGALGKPVWLMNRKASCWRWLRDRDDSPWYPTLRLFRQQALDDWTGVVKNLVGAARHWLESARPVSAIAPANPLAISQPQSPATAAPAVDLPVDIAELRRQGIELMLADRSAEALRCFEAILARTADQVEALVLRGFALSDLNDFAGAVASVNRAVQLEPDNLPVLEARAGMLYRLGLNAEALACIEQVIAGNPANHSAIHARSAMRIMDGELPGGFRDYESRLELPWYRPWKLETPAPRWLGDAPLAGRTIVLNHELGLGDTLQFARYAPLLTERGARVVLRAPQALHALLGTLPCDAMTVSEDEPLPPHDYHCPLMSLPLAFGTTLETIPANIPYLRAHPGLAAQWRARLGPKTRLRVGLAWAGHQSPPVDHRRDVPLRLLLPLMDLNVEFVSLQRDVPEADRALLETLAINRGVEQLVDFAETAALLEQLDLVISVDTAVAHLAGAMGKPVWILNRFAGCWRWMRARTDSPWYPSARLFRQPRFGDWVGVVAAVKEHAVHLFDRRRVLEHYLPGHTVDGQRCDGAPAAMHSGSGTLRDADGLMRRGAESLQQGNWAKALACLTEIIEREPLYLAALDQAARVLSVQGRYDEAVTCAQQLLALDPAHVKGWARLGSILRLLDRGSEALACLHRAYALEPQSADGRCARGEALWHDGRAEEALEWFDNALAADASHVSARENRSRVLLSLGNLSEGFRAMESRWDSVPVRCWRLRTAAPQWQGEESLRGKTILLHAEQGLGDSLQFARYAPLVAARGARVVLRVPGPLRALMESLAGVAQVASDSDPMPAHDYHCPLLSLPLAFGTTLQNIPARVPYLTADSARVARWRTQLGPWRRPRIGLAWAGRQTPPVKHSRDISLQTLRPLLDADADFISLQQEIPSADLELLATLSIARHGESMRDFADTAALLASLDLVISVDTAVAHLAGALGKPIWLLDRFAPCWRWLRGRSDSPWYPSLRLFRQSAAGDWAAVVDEVRSALSSFVARPAGDGSADVRTDAPDSLDLPTLMQQGVSLLRNDDFEVAVERFDAALSLDSSHAPAWDFRGRACAFLGRHAAALESFARVLSIDPHHSAAWVNQGVALASLNRRTEALACFDKALAIDARHPVLRLNRSLCALSLGRLEEGFEGYEARWECPSRFAGDLLVTAAPLWLGKEPLAGKSILLHHEQGYGDTIQFVRYAADVAARGARVQLYVPDALCELIRSSSANGRDMEVWSRASAPPRHDFHCPLMSLPLAFATQTRTIPAEIPYLRAHAAQAWQWRRRLGPSCGRRRIGVVWSGRRAPIISERDIDLSRLAPLMELDAEFVSLQTEVSDCDVAALQRLSVARHGESLKDFADAAALVANLDLVITVDTAMAHLAGALGKPVWILIRHAACWRWLQDRADSPWYPTARLFRQQRCGDWDAVLCEVVEATQAFISRA